MAAQKRSLGSFNAMGLSRDTLRGITKAGYRDATPIQRKVIPILIEGHDVVAMARTGSGKSAAFIIPMLEKATRRRERVGNSATRFPGSSVRAIILSPTRELATQTRKFIKTIGNYHKLNVIAILGGDSMEEQFAAIHNGPDVIVATPGRLLHLCVEMSLRLTNVEYVVFDEADKLFEMGLSEQLTEIIARLPESRQTCLFSATLPQMLADFAKAGLNCPKLVRLDLETTLSDKLSTIYLAVRTHDKYAALLYLLKHEISEQSMVCVFLPTRHHIDFVKELLELASIKCSHVYSSLDHEARKENILLFQTKKVRVLLVTDIAARGLDIPLLDIVINFNFPPKPKLFVHRVGRVARANREGLAYSLISSDELPYLHQLHVFLGKPVAHANSDRSDDSSKSGIYGSFPQDLLDEQNELIERWKSMDTDLSSAFKVSSNAMQQYIRSIGCPPAESVRAMKAMNKMQIRCHPIFDKGQAESVSDSHLNDERNSLLNSLRNFKPSSTIFEIGEMKKSKCSAYEAMKSKRHVHDKLLSQKQSAAAANDKMVESGVVDSTKDEHYIPYKAANDNREKSLAIDKPQVRGGGQTMSDAVMDLQSDDVNHLQKKTHQLKWDRKKKRYTTNNNNNERTITTESGVKIPASYKSNIYKKWKAGHKIDEDSMPDMEDVRVSSSTNQRDTAPRRRLAGKKKPQRRPTSAALVPSEQLVKARLKKEKRIAHDKWRQRENEPKRKRKGGSDAKQAR